MQAHGAEMLCFKYSNSSAAAADVNSDNIPLLTDARWQRFIGALTDKGYFKVCFHLPLYSTGLIAFAACS